MSKKLPLGLVLLLFTVGAFAQTIVGTSPENRNVILEEFTGINCVFCPQGHAIAQELKDDNPGDVFLVNIHSGGFATPSGSQPDFRTQWGAAIDGQSGLAGYPAGTVNRQNFPGQEQGNPGSTALGRGAWAAASAVVLDDPSYLNMAVIADVDVQTNQMTINVEGYYTADSPEATNKLNVAILQNNTLGPQTGGNAGNEYVHQHRLIDLVTGQWGEDITTTTATSFVEREYVYDIPADINGIPVELADLEVVVFMTETQQYVESGSGTLPTYSGITATNDANLRTIADIDATCATEVGTIVNVQNLGQNPITSLDFTYSINGGTAANYNWTGSITTLQSADIELPAIAFTSQATNTIEVSIADDEDNTNNELNTSFGEAPQGAGNSTLTIVTDQYANETSWRILNSAGQIVESGALNAGNNNSTVTYDIALDTEDCYTFVLLDSFGDGIFNGGGATLEDINGVILVDTGGDFGGEARSQFGADGLLGVNDSSFESIAIFPNPTTDVLNIVNADRSSVEIYDALGRRLTKVKKASNNEKVDVSRMPQGVYIVKITRDGNSETMSFIKK